MKCVRVNIAIACLTVSVCLVCALSPLSGKNTPPFRGREQADAVNWLTRKDPDEPRLASSQHLPRVAPLPVVILNSARDQFQSQETYQVPFRLAGEPKELLTVDARDHRFDGNRGAFFTALRAALQSIEQSSVPLAVRR